MRVGAAAGSGPGAGARPFVGRRNELQLVQHALADVGRARRVVVVIGRPGSGKTALIERAIAAVPGGVRVIWVGPSEVERDADWSTLRMLTADTADGDLPGPVAVATGRRHLQSGDPPSVADVAFAWADWIHRRSAAEPLLIVIDDLQWVDRASAAAIVSAMRTATACWVLGTRTDTDQPVDVERVVPPDALTTIGMSPLRRQDIGELVHGHFPRQWSPAELTYVTETSEGQPLHALELARERYERSGAPLASTRRSLGAMYADRLDALTPLERDVVAFVALARRVTVDELASMLAEGLTEGDGPPDPDLDGGLSALERNGLLVVGEAVRFQHALARHAVVEHLGTVERARIHRVLARHRSDPEERAVHLAHGTTRPDADVASELERAAGAAADRGASADAALLYERAAALTPSADMPALTRRRARAGIAYCDSGDATRAEPLLDAVAGAGLDEPLLAEVVAAATVVAAHLHGTDAAERVIRDALGRLVGGAHRGRAYRTLVRLHQYTDLRLAEQTALDALADAHATGGPDDVFAAEAALANARFLRGQAVDVVGLAESLEATADRGGGQSATWFIQELVAWDDRFELGRRLTERLIEEGRRTGAVNTVVNELNQVALIETRAGDVATARKHIDEALEIAAPPPGAAVFDVAEAIIVLAAIAGDVDEVHRLVREISAEIDAIVPVMQAAFWSYAGQAELLIGHTEHALDALLRASACADAVGLDDARGLSILPDLVEALALADRADEADPVVARLAEIADRCGSLVVRSALLRCTGILQTVRGDTADAVATLDEAVDAALAVDRPLELLRAQMALGVALRKHGARARAREVLDAARLVAEQLDAPLLARRIDDDAARLGARAVVTGLTPTERRIAELVVQGRSNREIATELIVSLRTVESNLTRVYRKVGVRSRTELAARGMALLDREPAAG